jgi:hypothetical protein
MYRHPCASAPFCAFQAAAHFDLTQLTGTLLGRTTLHGGFRYRGDDSTRRQQIKSGAFLTLHRALWKAPNNKHSLLQRIRGTHGLTPAVHEIPFSFEFPENIAMVGTYLDSVKCICPLPASTADDFPRRIAYFLTVSITKGTFVSESW